MATFSEIKQARRLVDSSILRMPGIVAVATGYKQSKGKRTDELAIIVYVAKKLDLDKLPFFHALPASFDIRGAKVPTDVVEVGYYVPFTYTARERPAMGGVSIGHLNVTAGTLGGLVCDEETGDTLILSNNHVLAAINSGQTGDHIVQPGTADGGTCHDDCIAELERFVPIDFAEGAVNYVDCAVAKPYDSGDVSFEIHDIGMPDLGQTYQLTQQDVVDATQVQKTGRTTQHTVGYVSAIDWRGTVLYEWTPAYFENQIVVETLDGSPVGLGGDSGSLVCTMDDPAKACGLLFAGPTSGAHYIANHIGEVFTRLGVKLCCATAETVRGREAEEYLVDLRKVRERLRKDRERVKYFDLYSRNSGKFLDAMRRNPELGESAQEIIVDVGKAIRNPRQRIDQRSVELGLELIDAVSAFYQDDKAFLKDMEEAKGLLKASAGKTVAQIIKTLLK